MAKKKTNPIMIIVIVLLLIGAIFAYNQFSVTSAPTDCIVPYVVESGAHIQNYNEWRAYFDQDISNQQLEDLGLMQESDGLYVNLCEVQQ